MTNQKVLLLGATGETGSSILAGLLDSHKFEVTALVRPSSASKPDVKGLVERGVKILVADISSPPDELAPLFSDFDVFISAISGITLLSQLNVATAAKKAGVKRFVPCAFATVSAAGGVMILRDQKEEVINHVKKLFLPYTFIDVGYWYQLSVPRLPSGRIDKYIFPQLNAALHTDGEAKNLLTDLRDVGHFVARIVDDERTLNKYVFSWGSLLTEKEVYSTMEEVSGEKLERKFISEEEMETRLSGVRDLLKKEPENRQLLTGVMGAEYDYSKYIRRDNRPEYAKYLGYLDARELYPELQPKSLKEFVGDLLDGKVRRPYSGLG